jgi:hypothetical protein
MFSRFSDGRSPKNLSVFETVQRLVVKVGMAERFAIGKRDLWGKRSPTNIILTPLEHHNLNGLISSVAIFLRYGDFDHARST